MCVMHYFAHHEKNKTYIYIPYMCFKNLLLYRLIIFNFPSNAQRDAFKPIKISICNIYIYFIIFSSNVKFYKNIKIKHILLTLIVINKIRKYARIYICIEYRLYIYYVNLCLAVSYEVLMFTIYTCA